MEEYTVDSEKSDGLPPSYQRTRRTYGLVSALLIAWELTGLEITASPFESVEVSLENPQAFPYVLIVLIFYFAFRFSLEWFQLDKSKRATELVKTDFVVANAIGFLALALFSVQAILEIQVADSFRPHTFVYLIGGLVNGGFLIRVYLRQRAERSALESIRQNKLAVGLVVIVDALLLSAAILRNDGDDVLLFALTFFASLVLSGMAYWFVKTAVAPTATHS